MVNGLTLLLLEQIKQKILTQTEITVKGSKIILSLPREEPLSTYDHSKSNIPKRRFLPKVGK